MDTVKGLNFLLILSFTTLLLACDNLSGINIAIPKNLSKIIFLGPNLNSINDQIIVAGVPIKTIDAQDGTDDVTSSGLAISYSCYYDTTIDGVVTTAANCSSLSGVSFSFKTGVMNWTPTLAQGGTYEFKIVASDGSLTDEEIFTIVVITSNQAPVLDDIFNQSVTAGNAITTINAADNGIDFDIDGNAITYSCFYDSNVNGSVASTNSCSTLAGLSFTASSGIMNWTTTASQVGSYEFKIIGTDGALSDSKIFSITVNYVSHEPNLNPNQLWKALPFL